MAEDVMAAPVPSPWQVVVDNFNRLTQAQKMAGAVALALSIAMLAGVWSWSQTPNYTVLFSNLGEKDGGAVIAALGAQNIPYKVEQGGATIMVPGDKANELRLQLASQGLPKGGIVGFELMDVQKLGMSQFNEQITYQRGLEGELARTIQSISSVSSARVHLAIPKQTAFLRDEEKPTASVVLTLYSGRTLEPSQVAGIVNLVASSVPKLSPDQVSIIDQQGNLLARKRDARMGGLDATQLEYVRHVEKSYMDRIQNILLPLLGEGNFRAQVAADVDFDSTEQTSEVYKPNPTPTTAIRSQQTSDNTTNQPQPVGVPGALTNQPPAPATAPITTPNVPGAVGQQRADAPPLSTSKSATTNYEIDKTVSHVRRSMGAVKRLSVAVVVNHKTGKSARGDVTTLPLGEEEIKQINDLVRQAVGYNQDRGDSLSIANAAFNEIIATPFIEPPLWKNPEIVALAKEAARWLLALAALTYVVLGVLRPLMRSVTFKPEPVVIEKTEEEQAAEAAEAEKEAAMEAARKEAEGDDEDDETPEMMAARIKKMSYEKKVARAREIAAKEPKLVAQLIKDWIGGGGVHGG